MRILKLQISFILFCFFFSWLPSFAECSDIISAIEYSSILDSGLPEVLKVNEELEQGGYRLKIIGQPIITKSYGPIIADKDYQFLIVRMEITNLSDQPMNWLEPNAFMVQETYLGHLYRRYSLDSTMSAKAAAGYGFQVFFSPIAPGEMLRTFLVFDVYPEAQSWIFTFSPLTFGSDHDENSVSFQLPDVLRQ